MSRFAAWSLPIGWSLIAGWMSGTAQAVHRLLDPGIRPEEIGLHFAAGFVDLVLRFLLPLLFQGVALGDSLPRRRRLAGAPPLSP